MYIYVYVREVQSKVIYYTTYLWVQVVPSFIPGLGTKRPQIWRTFTLHIYASVQIPVNFSKRYESYLRNSIAVKLELLFTPKNNLKSFFSDLAQCDGRRAAWWTYSVRLAVLKTRWKRFQSRVIGELMKTFSISA